MMLRVAVSTTLLLSALAWSATAASQAAKTPSVADAGSFDARSVPVSSATLPSFPYLDWPARLGPAFRDEKLTEFDRGYFVAGNRLQQPEGKLSVRRYFLRDAKLSKIEAMKNYDSAIKALGGVRIDQEQPVSEAFIARNGGDGYDISRRKLMARDTRYEYASYLVRTADRHVWFGLAIGDRAATVVTLEEKAMEQSVGLLKAEAMKAALDAKGHVALYINFDTDKAVLRNDATPVVGEIARLLRTDPALKLSIEGHTDDSGDAARNKALSQRRAEAVVKALTQSGIAGARLRAAGFGAAKPIADNATDEGRARNRRVELVKQ